MKLHIHSLVKSIICAVFFGCPSCQVKYEKKMTDLFAEIFRATPLCHVLNNEVFVVHGGIPGPDPRVTWQSPGFIEGVHGPWAPWLP
jgi:hypothetical protein